MKYILTPLFILLNIIVLYAQKDGEKLEQELYNSFVKKNTKKVKSLLASYFLDSKDLSKQVVGLVYNARSLGKTDEQKMIANLEKARDIALKTNYPIDIAYVEYGYLCYYIKIKKNDLALQSFHKSFEIFKKYKDYNTILAILMMQKSNLGQAATKNKDDISDFLLFYEYAKLSKNNYLINIAANNLGFYLIFNNKLTVDHPKFKKVTDYFKEAFYYGKIASEDSVELKSFELEYNINMATAYFELKVRDFQGALPYFIQAEKIVETNNLVEVRSFIYNNIGCYYMEQKDFKKAIKYFSLAYDSEKKNKNPINRTLLFSLDNLTKAYSEVREPMLALKFANESNDLREKRFNEAIEENYKSLDLFYKTKEKNVKIQQLEIEKEHYSKINSLYILLLILLSSTTSLAIAWYNKKKKLSTQEKEMLNVQNELLKSRKEKLEKKALLTSIQVDEKNKLIKEIQAKIQDSEQINWKTILKNETDNDNDIAKLNDIIENIDPSFIQRLRAASTENLTNTELKYSIYIYLDMDNQQISNIMKCDPNTVRVNKYRLKQRLALTREQDLKEYIQNL